MAEAENTDVGDPYLENLNLKPARQISRESQLNTQGKDLRKRGFNKLRVVVIEGNQEAKVPQKVLLIIFFSKHFWDRVDRETEKKTTFVMYHQICL